MNENLRGKSFLSILEGPWALREDSEMQNPAKLGQLTKTLFSCANWKARGAEVEAPDLLPYEEAMVPKQGKDGPFSLLDYWLCFMVSLFPFF